MSSGSGPRAGDTAADEDLAERIVMHTRSAADSSAQEHPPEQPPSEPSSAHTAPRSRRREPRIGTLAIIAGAAGVLVLAAALRKLFGGKSRS